MESIYVEKCDGCRKVEIDDDEIFEICEACKGVEKMITNSALMGTTYFICLKCKKKFEVEIIPSTCGECGKLNFWEIWILEKGIRWLTSFESDSNYTRNKLYGNYDKFVKRSSDDPEKNQLESTNSALKASNHMHNDNALFINKYTNDDSYVDLKVQDILIYEIKHGLNHELLGTEFINMIKNSNLVWFYHIPENVNLINNEIKKVENKFLGKKSFKFYTWRIEITWKTKNFYEISSPQYFDKSNVGNLYQCTTAKNGFPFIEIVEIIVMTNYTESIYFSQFETIPSKTARNLFPNLPNELKRKSSCDIVQTPKKHFQRTGANDKTSKKNDESENV